MDPSKENISNYEAVCWFCEKEPPDNNAAVEVEMYHERDVTRDYMGDNTNITWNKLNLKVPRCLRCKNVHEMVLIISYAVSIPFCILGLFVCSLIFEDTVDSWAGVLFITMFFCVIPFIIMKEGICEGCILPKKGIKLEESKEKFPGVTELRKKGFKIGTPSAY